MALDPYYQLGLARDADAKAIRRAYRKMASLHHPDKNPDDPHASTRFQLVQESYDILSDPARRARFDKGENADPFDPRRAAPGVLAGVYLEAVRHRQSAVLDAVRETLQGYNTKQRDIQRVARSALARYQAARKRLRYKGKGAAVLVDALESMIAKVESDILEMDRIIATNGAALELLGDYEDVGEPALAWGGRGLGDGTTTFST